MSGRRRPQRQDGSADKPAPARPAPADKTAGADKTASADKTAAAERRAAAASTRQRKDQELQAKDRQIAELHREFEETNRGLIALHAELDDARQAEARLAAIVQSSNDAMFSMTPQKVIQTWNAGAEGLLGYSAAQIVGRPIEVLVAGESPPQFDSVLERIRAGERAESYDTRWRRGDGSLTDVVVRVAAMWDASGALLGFSVVASDITNRLRTQAELAAARADFEVSEDRDRIARDLQDMVIQRVFRAGMALEGVASLLNRPEAVLQVEAVVGELDLTIQELRTTIFALHGRPQKSASLRAQLLEAASAAHPGLGFAPDVRFDGPVDAAVPDDVALRVVAVVEEALSNIARHSHASTTEVSVRAAEELVLTVMDNGEDMDREAIASGLRSIRDHVHALGGAFEVVSQSDGGTRIEARLPLSR